MDVRQIRSLALLLATAVLLCTIIGCAAARQPRVTIAPTYSYLRAGIELTQRTASADSVLVAKAPKPALSPDSQER